MLLTTDTEYAQWTSIKSNGEVRRRDEADGGKVRDH
jgi:hypothetical protein